MLGGWCVCFPSPSHTWRELLWNYQMSGFGWGSHRIWIPVFQPKVSPVHSHSWFWFWLQDFPCSPFRFMTLAIYLSQTCGTRVTPVAATAFRKPGMRHVPVEYSRQNGAGPFAPGFICSICRLWFRCLLPAVSTGWVLPAENNEAHALVKLWASRRRSALILQDTLSQHSQPCQGSHSIN